MADDIVFEINAEDVIAKLHLAGVMACKYDKNTSFIVNSGIKDDDPNAKPESPGKVKFMLDNSQGTYELGFVTQLGPYGISTAIRRILPQINAIQAEYVTKMKSKEGGPGDMTNDERKLYDQLEKLFNDEKNKEDLAKDDGIDIQKIIVTHIDNSISEIDKQLKAYDEKMKKSDSAAETSDKEGKPDEDSKDDNDKDDDSKKGDADAKKDANDNASSEEQNEYKKLLDKKQRYEKLKKHDSSAVSEEIGKEFIDLIVKTIAEASKNDANLEEVAKSQADAKNKAMTLAIDNLQKYMAAFAGPEAVKSFNAKDIIMIYVSQDVKSPNDRKLVSNFQILPIADNELEKHRQQQETDPSNCIDKVCFKMGFRVNIDK